MGISERTKPALLRSIARFLCGLKPLSSKRRSNGAHYFLRFKGIAERVLVLREKVVYVDGKLRCPFCGRLYKRMNLAQHILRNHSSELLHYIEGA
jgi:hypothetical protein